MGRSPGNGGKGVLGRSVGNGGEGEVAPLDGGELAVEVEVGDEEVGMGGGDAAPSDDAWVEATLLEEEMACFWGEGGLCHHLCEDGGVEGDGDFFGYGFDFSRMYVAEGAGVGVVECDSEGLCQPTGGIGEVESHDFLGEVYGTSVVVADEAFVLVF